MLQRCGAHNSDTKPYGHTCRISRSRDQRFHRSRAGQQIACPQLKVTSFEVARSCLESPHQVKVKNETSRDKKGRKPVHSRTRYIACSPFIAPPGALHELLLLGTIFLEGRSGFSIIPRDGRPRRGRTGGARFICSPATSGEKSPQPPTVGFIRALGRLHQTPLGI